MKNTLLSLALAGTLILENGCGERQPRQVYTVKEENSEIKLEDYYHLFALEIKTPGTNKTIYAESYSLDSKPHLTRVILCTSNKTSDYTTYSEEGRKMLKDTKPEFDKWYKRSIPKEKSIR